MNFPLSNREFVFGLFGLENQTKQCVAAVPVDEKLTMGRSKFVKENICYIHCHKY